MMRDFHLPGRSAVFATGGMVATSHPLAARLAVDTLARGGTAADAAVAGAVLLGLCEPQMTGLGGDCFVLVKPAGGEAVQALNGSGRAPAGADAEALRAASHETVPVGGAAPVTMPGAVDAFCTLLERHGRLGLDAVLGPVIPYFDEGVPVSPRTAFDWRIAEGVPQGTARGVYLPGGAPPAPGTPFALPGQAEVLRRIAREGRAGFYEGAVAEDMIASLNAAGGAHAQADLDAVRADWGKPIRGTYRGTELIEHPPNGQGATAILMANILSRFDLASMDPMGAPRIHLEAEAAKLAYDARNRFLSDPASMTRLDHMLSQGTADRLAGLIDPARAMESPAAASEAVHRETIYITAVDRDGMAVSLIYSIFHSFGSGLASDRFGILFQNRGAGFTLTPGHPNEMAPDRRPMHTIIPAMLGDGTRVTMPFGVMGGAYQPCGHARVLSNLVDYGMDPQAALDAPRAFWDAGVLGVERGYPDTVRAELEAMGHRVAIPEIPIGGAQAIRIHPSGVLEGASDPRKDGCALGL